MEMNDKLKRIIEDWSDGNLHRLTKDELSHQLHCVGYPLSSGGG